MTEHVLHAVQKGSNQQVCDVHVAFLQSGSANPQICAREEADSSQAIFRACMEGETHTFKSAVRSGFKFPADSFGSETESAQTMSVT